MTLRKLYPIILAAALVVSAASCKKDKETASSPAMDGMLRFDIPAFIKAKDVLIITPKGLKHPEGKGIGYYWKVTPGMAIADTVRLENGLSPEGHESDGSFRYHFPDSLGTYTVNCYAFATGYSSSYASSYTTVVKGGLNGSITGLGLNPSQTMTEEINGRKYTYVTVGETDWMCRNISDPSAGAPYANCKAMDDVFGRYYSYEEALTICPEGWELPSDADWAALAKAAGATDTENQYSDFKGIAAALMANAYFNEEMMWEYWPAVGDITNSTGFSAIPVGYANTKTCNFTGTYEYAVFWTSTSVEDDDTMAYYKYFIFNEPDMFTGKADKESFGASVRCIRK